MLNHSQEQAARHIDGPLLVIAGPGTGKTTLLSHRILHILKQTDTLPEQILCMTFTDAGTIAMRQKLEKSMGSESYRVHIYTFHAFCNELIQRYVDYVGHPELKAISELEQRELGRKLINTFPMHHPLRRNRGMLYYDLPALLKLYDWLKKEDKSPEYLEKLVKSYLEDLPNRDEFCYQRNYKEFKKGDPKPEKIKEETAAMEKLLAAARTFPQFQEMMSEAQRFDFNDMILWVLKMLKENEHIRLDLQERYQYLMVDEFQDTNGSQYELVSILASYWENNPNLFVVGDDDQSIYRFQGANVENIQQFVSSYEEHLKTVVLTENYRSSQLILDAAMQLIGHNSRRIAQGALSKKLTASLNDSSEPVRILECPNPLHETAFVAFRIQELLDQGVPASEIAVIYRSHQQAERLRKFLLPILEKRHTALNLKKKDNILEHPDVRALRTLLEYLVLESGYPGTGDHLLFKVLHFECFGLQPLSIAKFFAQASSQRRNQTGVLLRQLLSESGNHDSSVWSGLLSERERQELNKVASLLEKWIAETFQITTLGLIEKVLQESGMIKIAVSSGSHAGNRLQALQSFFDFAKEEVLRKQPCSLNDLIQTLQLLDEEALPVEQETLFYRKDGLNFLSAHGAKGLEFEHVFMIECTDDKWEKRSNKGLPFGLHKLFITDETELMEEERRLFYVGMTRAKSQLYISYPASDLKEKKKERSRFVSEVAECSTVVQEKIQFSDEELIPVIEAELQPAPVIPEAIIQAAYKEQFMKEYRLSVTHISSYLKCPVDFYYNHVLRIPAAMNDAMSFGNAMHQALEWFFKQFRSSDYTLLPSSDELVRVFEQYLESQQHAFTKIQFQRRMESGKEWLKMRYEQYRDIWLKETPFETEKKLSQIVIEGIPVKGVIDKMVYQADQRIRVVDYKTGKSDPNSRRSKLARPKADAEANDSFEKKYGGDYWRQIVFYKLLAEHDPMNTFKVSEGTIEFLEPDQDTYISEHLQVNEEDENLVLRQMRFVYDQLQAGNFSPGCGECEWCQFTGHYASAFGDEKK